MPKYDPKNSDFEDVPTISAGNPNAIPVATPNDPRGLLNAWGNEIDQKLAGKMPWNTVTPSQRALTDQALNAAGGAALARPEVGEALAAPLKAVGRGVRSLADFIGGKAAGLSPSSVSAYQAAPDTVEALAGAKEARQTQFADKALESASNRLGDRANSLENVLQNQLSGKTVPESSISGATTFGPKPPQAFIDSELDRLGAGPSYKGISRDQLPIFLSRDMSEANIPASDVYRGARDAGKAARFAPNPIDPLAEQARSDAAGKEWKLLRGAVIKAAPESEDTVDALKEGIDAQQGLKSGRNKPLSFFETGAPDTAANRQVADALTDSTRLERTANQLQAAKQMNAEPSGFINKTVIKPAGKALLRTTAALSDPLSSATDVGMDALNKLFLGGQARSANVPKMNIQNVKADDFEDVK